MEINKQKFTRGELEVMLDYAFGHYEECIKKIRKKMDKEDGTTLAIADMKEKQEAIRLAIQHLYPKKEGGIYKSW